MSSIRNETETEVLAAVNSAAKSIRTTTSPLHIVNNGAASSAALSSHIGKYGAAEIKDYIPKATTRGFVIAMTSAFLLLGGYAAFVASSNSLKKRGPAVNKMKLSNLPPPPQTVENVPPPPPTTAPGPAARAGTPVPVPDALIAPDMKDFANVDEISRASTSGGDGTDQGYMGLASEVDTEVREAEPNAYEFMAVDKEPYIDISELQKRVVYPDIARRAGIEGTVNIRVLVDKKGKPKKYIIESTDSDLLNKAAIDAVMNSTFTPAIQGTTPLDCWVSIPMNFRMK
jgi:TonB family protein